MEEEKGFVAHLRRRARTVASAPMPVVDYFSFPDLVAPGVERTNPWLIQAKGLCAGYGGVAVIHDVDLEVRPGEVVALLGANGAGKSTTLLALSGSLVPMSGSIWWNGALAYDPPHKRARDGMGYVTESRAMFTSMSAGDNLRVSRGSRELALELFPELERLLDRPAGLLSGGEQQMMSLARALCRRPRLLLVDEMSLGLAPLVVSRLLAAVRSVADRFGTGVLLVEQHVTKAFAVADRVYVMERGHIVVRGRTEDVRARGDEISRSYLATGAEAAVHG